MDGERAERHLRLMVEAELRRALAQPRPGGTPDLRRHGVTASHAGAAPMWTARWPSAMQQVTECVTRVERVAAALTAVGAIDGEVADTIVMELEEVLALRLPGDRAASAKDASTCTHHRRSARNGWNWSGARRKP